MSGLNFISEPGFCPHCGAILPLPNLSDHYTSCRCGYQIKYSDWHDMVLTDAKIILNEFDEVKEVKQRSNEDTGPVIERICGKCGHNQMSYKTQQLRSVDEGMSIFYCCLKCNFVEKEDS